MKTIQELNSKWYWRLIKVIYILGFLFLIGISALLYFELFQTYNPTKVDATIEYIDTEFKKNDLINSYNEVNKSLTGAQYSLDFFHEKFKDDNLSGDILRQFLILILASGKDIQGVKTCFSSSITNCPSSDWFIEKIINDNVIPCDSEYRNCTDFDSTIYIMKNLVDTVVDTRKEIEKDFDRLKNNLILLKEGKISYIYDVSTYYDKYDLDINYGYKDYLGFSGWSKVVLSFLATIAGLVILTVIFRGISHYIVLGKFNPEK